MGADVSDPTQVQTIGAPAGTDPALYLRAQLNRYTTAGGAPINFQIAGSLLPLTTAIDATTANRALLVLGRRAGAANQSYNDLATKALLATISQAWVNPVAYVQKNLPAVIDVVRLYGDANGLPAAKGVPQMIGGFALTPERVALVGGAALAAYFLFFKKGRR